jgi:hypothetical protein
MVLPETGGKLRRTDHYRNRLAMHDLTNQRMFVRNQSFAVC